MPESENQKGSDAVMRAQGLAIRNMFGPMTPWYDLQNRVFSLGLDVLWRRRLVRPVTAGPGNVVLDLAAGTLDVSLLLADHLPGTHILALDLCEPMLRFGQEKKIPARLRSRITASVADARALPLNTGSVDAVTVAFGVRNMVPRSTALAEILRVLRPGGVLHVLEFAPVTMPVVGRLYHWHLETLMPKAAGLVSRKQDAFRYLGQTIGTFPMPGAFARELEAAGLDAEAWEPLSCGIANIHRARKPGA